MSQRYIIENRDGKVLDLTSKYFIPDIPEFKPDQSAEPRQGLWGSVPIGDGKSSEREMSFTFPILFQDQLDYIDKLNEISGFFDANDGPFWLVQIEVPQKKTRVKLASFKPDKYEGGYLHFSQKNKLNLTLLDCLWEPVQKNVAEGLIANDQTVDVTMPSFAFETFPVIEITGQSDSPTTFALDAGQLQDGEFTSSGSMLIVCDSFGDGKVIRIDCVEGELYIEDVKDQTILTSGFFLKITRKTNAIRYQGNGSIYMKIEYAPRSLY